MVGRVKALHWGMALAASAILHWGALEWWLASSADAHRAVGGVGDLSDLGSLGGVSELQLVLTSVATHDGASGDRDDTDDTGDTREVAAAAPPETRPSTPPRAASRAPERALVQVAATRVPAPPARERDVDPPEDASDPLADVSAIAQSTPGGAASEVSGVGGQTLPAVSTGLPAASGPSHAGAGGAAGSGQGAALPGAGAAAATYWDHIVARVEAATRYPRRALRSRVSGRALVAVRIDRAGQLLECEIASSSGSALLDRDARATVERAAPFGQVPQSLAERDLAFDIPVAYDIARR